MTKFVILFMHFPSITPSHTPYTTLSEPVHVSSDHTTLICVNNTNPDTELFTTEQNFYYPFTVKPLISLTLTLATTK